MMNFARPWIYAVPFSTLLLTQCQKENAAESAPKSVVEAVVEEVAESMGLPVGLSAEERARIVPITGMVKADVDGVASLKQVGEGLAKLRGLKAWEFFTELAPGAPGAETGGMGSFAQVLGPQSSQEWVMVFGKGMKDFLSNLRVIQGRLSYYQYRDLSRTAAESVVKGDLEGMENMESLGQGSLLEGISGDMKMFLPALKELSIPPLLFGVQIEDEEERVMTSGQISQLLAMVGQQSELVAFEAGGGSFTGLKLEGAMVAEQMEANAAELSAQFGSEVAQELISLVREKQVVMASATMGQYVMLYLGPDVESCPLAESLDDSLAANSEVSFIDGFQGKATYGFLYGSKEVLSTGLENSSISDTVSGVIDGLREAEGFGDPRELIALLGLVEDHQEALMKFYSADTFGGMISEDGGLVFDTFGGIEITGNRQGKALSLGSLGEGERTLLFADGMASTDYQKAMHEYLDLLCTIAYTAAQHVAGLEPATPEMARFSEWFQVFDENARENLLKVWNGITQADAGLGAERALVVDLAGAMPSVPGIPPAVVEKVSIPRASYVAAVKDRAQLGEAWLEMEGGLRGLLVEAREMGAGDFSLPAPTSSEKDGQITWYYDLAAYSDDAKPSVTLNDDWFAASTSRHQALELLDKAAQADSDGGRVGAWLKLDLDVLSDYLSETLAVVEEQGAELFPHPDQWEKFQQSLPKIRQGIAALEEFKEVTIHEREEGGQRRTTFRISMD
ncbi:hypothetical protein HNR46_000840 [Haloferula luteola]|uniref:Uncharacterized protein n=1 Tax=Haloferula luteola TaxID=595692 RepID=A0A840UXV4_9BACT|nr:hypothetical protein [Haloferula luteola]MBB5350612.1 hypothetical protein [Haloferula luteola]